MMRMDLFLIHLQWIQIRICNNSLFRLYNYTSSFMTNNVNELTMILMKQNMS